jgi:gliding motility-associated-like protein
VDIVGIGMGVGTMGAYFGDATLSDPPPDNLYPVTPQVVNSGAPITDMNGWTEVSGCFVANGGEQYITIGNFFPDAASASVPLAGSTAPYLGYVLIDDVSVEAVDLALPLSDITSCDGVPVVLDASSVGDSWTWDDGSAMSTLAVDGSGVHWVDINAGGCIVRDSCTVLIALPPTAELGPDTMICQGLTLLLSVEDPNGTIAWSDGSSGVQVLVDRTGVYAVEVANACGSRTDTIAVTVEECPCTVFAPNAFSPNADGINDAFTVVRDRPFPIELSIFDRWGEMIFQQSGPGPQWTGADAQPGVYVWRTESVFNHMKQIGHVVLIR